MKGGRTTNLLLSCVGFVTIVNIILTTSTKNQFFIDRRGNLYKSQQLKRLSQNWLTLLSLTLVKSQKLQK